jgi:hypothetical protein
MAALTQRERLVSGVAVVGCEELVQLMQIKEMVDASKQMIGGSV